uniref:Transposase Tc1-like domain-containing protein n=1 Tax=Neolamprologus brichardi TaxID=32507 RepID=A0A3Q4GFY6_NEOBR
EFINSRNYCRIWRSINYNIYSFLQKALGNWGNSDRKRSGSPKATTESQDKFLRVNSLHDWWLIGQQLNSGRRKQVSVSTMKRRLRAAGLTGRVEARKLLLRCQNKTKRLAWAMKHCHWITEE